MKLGKMKFKAVLKSHVLSGRDVTSNVGTKAAVLKSLPEKFLQEFGGKIDSAIQDSYQETEKYIVKTWCSTSHRSTFNKLR